MHFAAHGHTAAEVIYERADAEKPFMGLTSFSGEIPVMKDISVIPDKGNTIYRNDESEQILKSIEFNFPIYKDGKEFRKLLCESNSSIENVALLNLK